MDFEPLRVALAKGQTLIIERLAAFAERFACRESTPCSGISVEVLAQTICRAALQTRAEHNTAGPLSVFGSEEAQKHRACGMTLSRFLHQLKYCRQCFRDCLETAIPDPVTKSDCLRFLEQCFDQVEIGVVGEWDDGGLAEQGRQKAEEELRRTSEMLGAIIQAAPTAIIGLDLDGNVRNVWNPAAEKMLGWKAEEVMGRPLPSVPAESQEEFRRFRDWVRNGKTLNGIEVRRRRRDGSLIDYSIHASALRDAQGRVIGNMAVLVDSTAQKQFEEALRESETRFRMIVETAEEGIWQVDREGRTVYVNQRLEQMLGCETSALKERQILDFMDGEERQAMAEILSRREPGERKTRDFRLAGGNGLVIDALISTSPLIDEKGEFAGTIVMVTDITDRKRAEDELVQTSNQFKTLFAAAPLPITTLDRQGRVLMWNSAAEKVFGWREEEIINRVLPIVPEAGRGEFFQKNRRAFAGEVLSGLHVQRQRKDGQLLDLLLFNAPLYDAQQNIYAIMAILMDVTEQKRSQEQIAFLAHHDRLTGLANRTLLAERFDQATAHARRSGTQLALCAIDLDEFKHVNDLLGHHSGDKLLCQIADRLQNSVRRTDTVCRMGGDEFIILFGDISDTAVLTTLIRKVSDCFSAPFLLDGHKQSVTLSMGVAVFPEDGGDFETLFKNADAAMYFAKETGRNSVQFFRREIRNQIQQRLAIEQGLRRALAGNELLIHYQPVCQVAENRIVGAEALIRWHHPSWGWMPPSQFIPIAEDTNLILPLGEWLITEVCRTIREWDLRGRPPIPVAVNVSAKQLFHEGFPTFISRTLLHFGIKPKRLELEVTENVFLENLSSVEAVMRELKAIGVGLALDDFGTGYSSLSYLKRFRIDKLKIDRSFIADVCRDEQDAILADTIILLGRSLGLKVVAEGVETEEQLSFLRQRGCDYFQGYLCSRPLPPETFATLLLRPQSAGPPFGNMLTN